MFLHVEGLSSIEVMGALQIDITRKSSFLIGATFMAADDKMRFTHLKSMY